MLLLGERLLTMGLLGIVENIMSANATPNDMRLAQVNLCSILECRTAIGRPSHLKDTSRLPHTFDA